MKKPDKLEAALLQARHLYNEAKITEVIDGGGFTIGKDTIKIEVNRLAWGYFEQSLLNALKDHKFIREWSPHLFGNDKECPECKGAGRFPYTPGTKEYDQAYDDFYKFDGKLEDDAPPYGTPIAKFCSPCQGTGIVLKPQNCDSNFMSVTLKPKEKQVLADLAKKKGMTEENLMRMALRVYQTVEVRLERGEKIFSNDPVSGCGGED